MLSNYFLVQSLSGSKGLADLYAASYRTAATARTSLAQDRLNAQIDAEKSRLAAYDDLKAAVRSFRNALGAFDSSDEIASMSASSSDSTIATASVSAGAGSGVYDLSVSALARAETAVSGAFADSDTTIVGSGTLTIQLGEYDSGGNTFTPGAAASVDVDITNGTLDDIANAINNAGAGVTASVVENGGSFYLSVTSSTTGAENGYSITVSDADGTDTDMSGLSQFAYDQTAASGAGENLTQTRAAQDASYTINGIAATSASNSGISIAPDVTATLRQTGDATITVTPDSTELSDAATSFVDAFNELSAKIADLTGSDGALKGDRMATQLADALKAPLSDSFATGDAYEYLYEIGITPQTDGTLALDEDTFAAAFADDPAAAVELLATAAADLDAIAETYAADGGTIEDVSRGFQNNLVYLEGLLPAIEQMGGFADQYASLLQTSTVTQLYTATLGEDLVDQFPDKAYSLFA